MSPKILRHSVSFTCLPGNKAVSLASSLAKIRASAALAQLVEHRIRNSELLDSKTPVFRYFIAFST